jgi:plastocyanin
MIRLFIFQSLFLILNFNTAFASPDFEILPVSDLGSVSRATRNVDIPIASTHKRFVPFVLSIRAGDTVQFRNFDPTVHSLTSVDRFSSTTYQDFDSTLTPLSTTGAPGLLSVRFRRTGMFVYYCKYHAALGSDNQPVSLGNENQTMMGVIVIR